MAQIVVRNPEGMATSFQNSQLVNLSSTINSQLAQVLKKIEVGAALENKPLALYQTKQTKGRQFNTLRALMVSPSLWASATGAVEVAVMRQIKVYSLTSDFVSTGSRFIEILPRVTPRQERVVQNSEILDMGASGQIDLGVAYTSSSLEVKDVPVTNTFPATGLIEFDILHVGTLVTLSYVTVPIYNVIKIVRTHEQNTGEYTGHEHPAYAYVMHPMLAPMLNITIPVV